MGPNDFAAALRRNRSAREFFGGLSYSKKNWFVISIEGAKTPETRARRITGAVEMLGAGRAP